METLSPPGQSLNLSPQLYYQLVHTLTGLLPPPLDDSPEALRARNHAAIAKVASLRPVNANEADLAAHTIAARAQAEDIMRLIRVNAGNVAWVSRLNAQYTSMVRTSLSVHAHLMRAQAVRQKREAVEATANEDARSLHIAERSMLTAADRDFERVRAPGEAPAQAPVAAPTPSRNHTIEEDVSETNQNSHSVAFETPMSERPVTHAEIAATQAVATPSPRRETAQAAPPKPAAVAPAPKQAVQSSRTADPRDRLLWADAMRHVSAEMTAGLSAIPPAYRKQQQMRAKLLSSVASQITMQVSGTPPARPRVAVPRT
jgi:hypothetical protein